MRFHILLTVKVPWLPVTAGKDGWDGREGWEFASAKTKKGHTGKGSFL